MISEEKIKYLSRLSRISIGTESMSSVQEDISRTVEFVSEIESKVKSFSIKAGENIVGLENIFKEDDQRADIVSGQSLVSFAPRVRDGFVVVKEILKR